MIRSDEEIMSNAGEKNIELFSLNLANYISSFNKAANEISIYTKAEITLYRALISYIYAELNYEEHNFTTLKKMIDSMNFSTDDINSKNIIDYVFEELELGTEKMIERTNSSEIKTLFPNIDYKVGLNKPISYFSVIEYKKFKNFEPKVIEIALLMAKKKCLEIKSAPKEEINSEYLSFFEKF